MNVFIDDQPAPVGGQSLGAVLEAATEQLGEQQRVIVEVHLDGQPLVGQDLDAALDAATEGRELRLYSAGKRELVRQTVGDVRQRLGEARQLQQDAADLLQQDEAGQALAKVAQTIEVWLQTQQALTQSAALLGYDLAELEHDGEPLRAYTDELLGQLQSLKQLIADGDTVSLADALAYEWPDLTERWDGLLGRFDEVVAQGH